MQLRTITLSGIFAILATTAFSDFGYNDFSSGAGLSFVGNTQIVSNRLRITPNTNSQRGAAYYTQKQSVAGGFRSTFQFQISGTADGFTFIVQNEGLGAIGAGGSGLGYGLDTVGSTYYPGIKSSLAIEFDIYRFVTLGDPNDNHVSIHSRGTLENSPDEIYSLGLGTPSFTLKDGNVHTAVIDYVQGQMNVYVGDLVNPLVTSNINLSTLLALGDGNAWVGFTGGTGGASAQQDILSWQYKVTPEPSVYAMVVMGLGGILYRRRGRMNARV
jgi:hypothetical protein